MKYEVQKFSKYLNNMTVYISISFHWQNSKYQYSIVLREFRNSKCETRFVHIIRLKIISKIDNASANYNYVQNLRASSQERLSLFVSKSSYTQCNPH